MPNITFYWNIFPNNNIESYEYNASFITKNENKTFLTFSNFNITEKSVTMLWNQLYPANPIDFTKIIFTDEFDIKL